MEELLTIQHCKEKLRELGTTTLLIPEPIEQLAAMYPTQVVCNEITIEIAAALMRNDRFLLYQCADAVNDDLYDFLLVYPSGSLLMIHHYQKGVYVTSIVEFKHVFGGVLISSNKPIECSNIIAIAAIGPERIPMKRSIEDTKHKIFVILSKILCT